MREGKLQQAEEHVRDATTLIGQMGDMRDLPGAFWMLADIARLRGDLLEATSLLERALHTARVIGDLQMIAVCLSGLAQLLHLEGDEERALELARESMRLFIQGGDLVGAATALDAIAEIATAMGDPAHAAWCVGAVDGVLQRLHLSRHESAPGEHQARVDAVVAALGEPAYRKHWTRGHVLSTDAVLADALAWSPSGNSAAMPKVQDPESRRDISVTLSPSERELLCLLASGKTDREIAADLLVSPNVVAAQTRKLFDKLDVADRVQAATVAVRRGIL